MAEIDTKKIFYANTAWDLLVGLAPVEHEVLKGLEVVTTNIDIPPKMVDKFSGKNITAVFLLPKVFYKLGIMGSEHTDLNTLFDRFSEKNFEEIEVLNNQIEDFVTTNQGTGNTLRFSATIFLAGKDSEFFYTFAVKDSKPEGLTPVKFC